MNKIKNILNMNKALTGTLLFGSFMLIQLITLRLSNLAGQGYLEKENQEYVYPFIQIIVILGFLLHTLFQKIINKRSSYINTVTGIITVLTAGTVVLLFSYEGSTVYIGITGLTVLCLGFFIGAVYLKLSKIIADGAKAGACIGIGYAAAVALQYVFQLQWTFKPVLLILVIVSFIISAFILSLKNDNTAKAEKNNKTIPYSKLIFSVIITLAMFVFTHYYNSYIHQLQIESGYTDYNVYSWPRLLMIPAILLSGFIGDIKKGKFLPIFTLCVVVISLVNTSILGRETYLLNMCLYYISLTAVIAYYHITFLRMAQHTKSPAVWSAMGRLLDSVFVILSFILNYSQFSLITVLIIDITAIALIVILMAFGGDYNFGTPPEPVRIIKTVTVTVPVPSVEVDPFPILQEEYGITPGEMKVIRELVGTDDKQDVISSRLNMSVNTLRHHITSIYKKTGVQTRSALCKLVSKTNQ